MVNSIEPSESEQPKQKQSVKKVNWKSTNISYRQKSRNIYYTGILLQVWFIQDSVFSGFRLDRFQCNSEKEYMQNESLSTIFVI